MCDVPPAVAVITTDVAFVVCHDSVTLCPLLIEVLFAEKVRVGEPGPGFPIACDPQPHRPAERMKTREENRTGRKPLDRIMALPTTRVADCDGRSSNLGCAALDCPEQSATTGR